MKFSVLICTIPERKIKFNILLNKLNSLKTKEVEILFDDRPKGLVTIGEKRNNLLQRAKGEYIAFIDDDDDISESYIEKILLEINKNPDCIGFKIMCNMEGIMETAASSIKYDWMENVDGYRYVRSIYHKTPVKKEIALKCLFPNKSFGEDYEYSLRLKQHLKKEVFIDDFLYYYNYKYENPVTKYGL